MPNSGALRRIRAYFERVLDGHVLHAYTPAKSRTRIVPLGGSTVRLRTIGLIVTLAVGILLVPLSADAQPAGQVTRIGFLAAGSVSPYAHLVEAFRQGLRDLGYAEGQNIAIEFRWAEGRYDRLADFAAELVRLKVEVIVAAGGTPAVLAAKNATRTIPIVFPTVNDPVAVGFVVSLARPGGNITGLTLWAGLETLGKQLELLKETVPQASRVALLWNPANPSHTFLRKETELAGRSLGAQLQIHEVRDPNQIERAFSAMIRERADALIVLADAMFQSQTTQIADLALKNRLPTMFWSKGNVEAGGLMAYGASFPDLYRRAAHYVGKILKGAKPADLPVEQPTKFELVINLKTAKALGLTIPQSVLIRADEVIRE